MTKQLFKTLVLTSIGLISSCQHLADVGPVDIDKKTKDDEAPKTYQVIDITSDNATTYHPYDGSRKTSLPPLEKRKLYSDLISYKDILKLLVIDSGEAGLVDGAMSMGPFEVPSNGKISLPHMGEVSVKGKTLRAVELLIQERYTTISNSVQISLSRESRQAQRANITGIVNTPGQQTIDRKGVTLTDLIARGGGTQLEPYLCIYNLHRGGKTYPLSINQLRKQHLLAQDGDLLEVTRNQNRYVSVFGKTGRQKNQAFTSEHTHLSDILAASGGLNGRSSHASGIFVFRIEPNGTKRIFRFNLKQAEGLFAARKFHVAGRDMVYITEAPLSRWNRAIKDFLSLSDVSSVANASRLVN